MRWFRIGRQWWMLSSALGLGVSSGLLALAIHDEARRRVLKLDGSVEIASEATMVLKTQLVAYFGLCCLASAAVDRGDRVALLVAGNVVLTSAALYRLRLRHRMIRWVEAEAVRAALRNRRWGDAVRRPGEAAGE